MYIYKIITRLNLRNITSNKPKNRISSVGCLMSGEANSEGKKKYVRKSHATCLVAVNKPRYFFFVLE